MRFHCNAIASFFIFLIIDASCTHCQDDGIEEAATIHVPNPGLVRKGNSASPKNGLLKVTQSLDATSYEIIHKGKPAIIVKRANGSISVTHTKTYRFKDLDQLRTKHPELYMHFRAFPKSTHGNWPIRLTLEIDSVCNAKNKTELKRKDSEAFEIYQQYAEPKKILITVTPTIVVRDE